MNLNFELLQFFAYKKIIKRRQINDILLECDRLKMPADRYLIAKDYCTEITALASLGEFYSMPYIELPMLEIDESLIENFSLTFLKKQKIVPISIDNDGIMLVAIARPLDFNAISSIATFYTGKIEFILVPSVQIDIYVDSVVAVKYTEDALDNLNKDKDKRLISKAMGDQDFKIESE
ncbi:MAG: hypothetical protein PHU02_05575, partial [Bacilli bacterium]|nr:hypothetical protein [Bacilli bacterium]